MSQEEQGGNESRNLVSSTEEDSWRPGAVDMSLMIRGFEVFREQRKIGHEAAIKLLHEVDIYVVWSKKEKPGAKPVKKEDDTFVMPMVVEVESVKIKDFEGKNKRLGLYTRNFFLGCLRHVVESTPLPAQRFKPRRSKKEIEAAAAESPEAAPVGEDHSSRAPVPPVTPEQLRLEGFSQGGRPVTSPEVGLTRSLARLRHEVQEQARAIRELKEQHSLMSRGVWRVAKQLARVLHEVKSRPLLSQQSRKDLGKAVATLDEELERTVRGG